MLRSMMQVYVQGSGEAIRLYQKAFDAGIVREYPCGDGTYYHAELDVYGQILAVSEARHGFDYSDENPRYAVSFAPGAERNPGNPMQFGLHFGEGNADKVLKGYGALREGGVILYPPGPVNYSPCMCDLVDRFGVRWCLFE